MSQPRASTSRQASSASPRRRRPSSSSKMLRRFSIPPSLQSLPIPSPTIPMATDARVGARNESSSSSSSVAIRGTLPSFERNTSNNTNTMSSVLPYDAKHPPPPPPFTSPQPRSFRRDRKQKPTQHGKSRRNKHNYNSPPSTPTRNKQQQQQQQPQPQPKLLWSSSRESPSAAAMSSSSIHSSSSSSSIGSDYSFDSDLESESESWAPTTPHAVAAEAVVSNTAAIEAISSSTTATSNLVPPPSLPPPPPPPLWTDQFATDVTKYIRDGIDATMAMTQENSSSNRSSSCQQPFLMHDLLPQDLRHASVLGSGAFSNVTKVTIDRRRRRRRNGDNNNNSSNTMQQPYQYYACKSLKRDLLPAVLPATITTTTTNSVEVAGFVKAAQELAREAYLLSHLEGHAHIIALQGWTEGTVAAYAHYQRHDAFFLVLELLSRETLDTRIVRWNNEDDQRNKRNRNRMMTTQQRRRHKSYISARRMEQLTICQQLANALDYIHSKRIVYRDLKPQNIGFVPHAKTNSTNNNNMATDNNGNIVQVKLMDFGLARPLPSLPSSCNDERGEYHQPQPQQQQQQQQQQYPTSNDSTDLLFNMTGMVGTIRYMAPEVYQHRPYNTKADIYSWSIVSYEVLSQAMPYLNMGPDEYQTIVCQQGVRPNLWNEQHQPPQHQHIPLSSEDLVLLANAWRTDPAKRLPFSHIQHQLDLFLQKETLIMEAEQLLSNMPDTYYRGVNNSNNNRSMGMLSNSLHVSTTTAAAGTNSRQRRQQQQYQVQHRRMHQEPQWRQQQQQQRLQNGYDGCYSRGSSKRQLDVNDDDDDDDNNYDRFTTDAVCSHRHSDNDLMRISSTATTTTTCTTNYNSFDRTRRRMVPSNNNNNHQFDLEGVIMHQAMRVLSNDPDVNMNNSVPSPLPSNQQYHHNLGGDSTNHFKNSSCLHHRQEQLRLITQQQRVTTSELYCFNDGTSPLTKDHTTIIHNSATGGSHNSSTSNANYRRRSTSTGDIDTLSKFRD